MCGIPEKQFCTSEFKYIFKGEGHTLYSGLRGKEMCFLGNIDFVWESGGWKFPY
jgi:hypothetical protein